MKKSSKVALTLLPAFAAMFMAACDEPPADDGVDEQYTRACLDPQGNVVDGKLCEDMYERRGYVNGHASWFYYWYYRPGRVVFVPGSRITVIASPRSFSAPEGMAFGRGASVGVVSRGGFGATGMAHGVGE